MWRLQPWSALLLVAVLAAAPPGHAGSADAAHRHLERAKIYLQAADYRRAIEACMDYVRDAPSVDSYVYLTYAFHALDGYISYLAAQDKWVAIEQLYVSLTFQGPHELVDPPEVLARIAKELIQGSVLRQSDVTAAMAARLDEQRTGVLWKQQTAWRAAHPEDWWAGVPPEWRW